MNAANWDNVYRTVFQQEWWLDCVTDGHYSEVFFKSDNLIQGWLPYVTRKRWGYLVSEMPFLTHTLGPVILPGAGSETTEFLRHNTITRELLAQLPKLAHFRQVLSPDDTGALGFIECGFHIKVQFTFIGDCTESDSVWKRMRDKTRNLIRRSEEKNIVQQAADAEEFLRFYADNCRHRNDANRYEDPRTQRVLRQSIERDQGRIYLCRDRATGAASAGIAVVWDSRYMYFLMSTRHAKADSGAVSLLLWTAMQEAQRRGLNFDFDGVTTSGTYRFLSGFGGKLARRHVAEKFNPVYHSLDRMRASFYGNMKNPYST
jgi:lipid II:glycine glycyltransferase (peptidoglycan interpeptide bridge formation enzyme)